LFVDGEGGEEDKKESRGESESLKNKQNKRQACNQKG